MTGTLTNYPITCTACDQLAPFKIASAWSDGTTNELKTYSLSCKQCLKKLFAEASVKQKTCRLTQGETLESPGVYERTDARQWVRRPDLEGT
jgi:hypothetical protein